MLGFGQNCTCAFFSLGQANTCSPKNKKKKGLLQPIYLLVRIFSEVAIVVNKQRICVCVALTESPCGERVKPDG